MAKHRNALLGAAVVLLVGGILQSIVGEAGQFSTILLVGAVFFGLAATQAFAAASGRDYSVKKSDTSGK